MKGFLFSFAVSAVLLLAETCYGQSSREAVLKMLDELDTLAELKFQRKSKGHFCTFHEPTKKRMLQHFQKSSIKSFEVPCATVDASRDKRRLCTKYSVIFEPAVREVTKMKFRGVRGCCNGWKGLNCNERDDEDNLSEKRQLLSSHLHDKSMRTTFKAQNSGGTSCWEVNVTVEYGRAEPFNITIAHDQAVGLMRKVESEVKAVLSYCQNVTLKVGKIEISWRGNRTALVIGTFNFQAWPLGSIILIGCIRSALASVNLTTQLKLIAPKIDGLHPATAAYVTYHVRTICCADGSILRDGGCAKCPAGSYHAIHLAQCVGCKMNSFQPHEGQTYCLLCPNGTISDGPNATKCTKACSPSCKNNGICSAGQCFCPNSFTGPACEKALCAGPCLNGGTCAAPNKCKCLSGYSGTTCETALCLAGCANHGSCVAPELCSCAPGFTGSQCQFGMSFCSGMPNGDHRDPDNCYGFISCSNGITHRRECPAGLRFNYTINQCDWPLNVPCDYAFIPTTSPVIAVSTFPLGAMNVPDLCFTWRSHVKTFDGRYFYFPGRCTYKLVHDCRDDMFSIHIFTDPLCKDIKNCRRAVNLYFNGLEIKIHFDAHYKVTVDQNNVSLPHIIDNLVIEKVSNYVVAYGFSGITVLWDGNDAVYVHVTPEHMNNTCGLCGNYNGIPDDDFMTYGRQQVSSIARFGNSWRMTDVNDLCPNVREDDTKNPCNAVTSGNRTQIQIMCSFLRNSTFSLCHVVLDPSPYIKMCEEELCSCSLTNRLDCACSAFTQYSRACARHSAPVQWRSRHTCPVICPETMEFTECGSSCPVTCQTTKTNYICPERCIDGCQCANGTVFDGQRCVPVKQCPCFHNKKQYSANSVIKRDCNNCSCFNGRWICTSLPCPGICSSIGDPHYRTFDGLQFSFMGNCRYIMAKDCVNSLFTVLVDNMACGSDGTVTCTKNVHVHLNGTKVLLAWGGTVFIDGARVIEFPRVVGGSVVRQLSSTMTLVYSSFGVDVKWDGISRVYVKVHSSFRGKTCGLCGTFNKNQNDDLTTKESVVESSVIAFGNSWKVNPGCNNTKSWRHPCEVQIQRRAGAEKLCNRLLQAPFNKCHYTIDPADGYIASCMYDVCGCQHGTQCLCSAIAAYVYDCSRQGIIIDWMNSKAMPECNAVCSTQGQVYQVCGPSCKRTCREISMDIACVEECAEGCNCPKGTALRDDNQCVPYFQCPCYHDGRKYQAGTVLKPTKCSECLCKDGKFLCANKSCVVCPAGQTWVSCGLECAKTCDNFHLPCLESKCQDGCVCLEGTVLSGKQCVNSSQCTCHHGGHSYKPGQQITVNCNTW